MDKTSVSAMCHVYEGANIHAYLAKLDATDHEYITLNVGDNCSIFLEDLTAAEKVVSHLTVAIERWKQERGKERNG